MGVGSTKNNGLYILPSLHQLQNLQNEVRVPPSQSNQPLCESNFDSSPQHSPCCPRGEVRVGEGGPAARTDPLLPSGFDAHFCLMPTPGWGQQRSQAECHRHRTRNNGLLPP